jgi:hypothetical protein
MRMYKPAKPLTTHNIIAHLNVDIIHNFLQVPVKQKQTCYIILEIQLEVIILESFRLYTELYINLLIYYD